MPSDINKTMKAIQLGYPTGVLCQNPRHRTCSPSGVADHDLEEPAAQSCPQIVQRANCMLQQWPEYGFKGDQDWQGQHAGDLKHPKR